MPARLPYPAFFRQSIRIVIFGSMSSLVSDILNLAIFIAGVISVIRFPKMDTAYYPFIFLLWIGCVNEILSIVLVRMGLYTIVNSNIYILIESLMLTWYFKKMKVFNATPCLFFVTLFSLACFWMIENLVMHPVTHYSIYFRIYYSALIVLMSILTINHLLLTEQKAVGRNASFILCVGFITYFLIKVLVNAFWLYGLSSSREFLLQVSRILVIVNLITNLIYALAIVWIPKKQPSLLPL